MILAVTGHRPHKLGGYSEQVFLNLVALATYAIQQLKPETVITGMALGWDQAVAQACINLKLPFVAYIPCIGQERQWPIESQKRWNKLLENAKNVLLITDGPYDPGCMLRRNEAMVSDSDQLLALWDGSSGGTAHCTNYAVNNGKKVTNCWNIWVSHFSVL